MTSILAMADLHGRIPKLPKIILASRIDILALCGDIPPTNPVNWDFSNPSFRKVDVAKEAVAQREWWDSRLMPWLKNFKEVKQILYVKGNHCFLDAEAIPGITALNTGSRVIEVDGLKIGMLAGSMPLIGEWSDEVDEFEMNQRILNMNRDVDILFSHVPPLGVMDQAYNGDYIGCKSLREAIFGVGSAFEPEVFIRSPYFEKLQHHFYGHCHEGRGVEKHDVRGRQITFVNCAETYCSLETSGKDLLHHPGRIAFHNK